MSLDTFTLISIITVSDCMKFKQDVTGHVSQAMTTTLLIVL